MGSCVTSCSLDQHERSDSLPDSIYQRPSKARRVVFNNMKSQSMQQKRAQKTPLVNRSQSSLVNSELRSSLDATKMGDLDSVQPSFISMLSQCDQEMIDSSTYVQRRMQQLNDMSSFVSRKERSYSQNGRGILRQRGSYNTRNKKQVRFHRRDST